jgi:hypothetical protein
MKTLNGPTHRTFEGPLRIEGLQQLWELFCEEAPEERSKPYASIEEAIAAFDAELGI